MHCMKALVLLLLGPQLIVSQINVDVQINNVDSNVQDSAIISNIGSELANMNATVQNISTLNVSAQTITCPRGYYCIANVTEPIPCPMGTYQPEENAPNSSYCLKCNMGTYNSIIGMPSISNCTLCHKGTYGTGLGLIDMDNCTLCHKGTYGCHTQGRLQKKWWCHFHQAKQHVSGQSFV